jgi:Fe-Mn family superoxide dismutase
MHSTTTYQARDFSLPHIPGISEKTMSLHLGLYQGYVKHYNLITSQIERIKNESHEDIQPHEKTFIINELSRRKGFEFDGIRNHEIFFESFEQGPTELSPESALHTQIASDFGSHETWRDEFTTLALTRGIGWVMTYFDPRQKKLINFWIDEQHIGHATGLTPIVALDMWEHAYLLDYAPTDKKQYVDAFLDSLNWNICSERFLSIKNREL